MDEALKAFLDQKVLEYNSPDFIADDPVSVPHRYSRQADREIAGFFAAILAWGNRRSIIRSCLRLMELMDDSPADFVLNHEPADLRVMDRFVHRTFNSTDLLFILTAFKEIYQQYGSLEPLFTPLVGETDVRESLIRFHNNLFMFDFAPERSRKHIATPERGSACKRLNLFLRWMVRRDERGVDFGLWRGISPSCLITPLDVHVQRVAFHLGMLKDSKSDWKTATELTRQFRDMDAEDPVKYDFALFGLGLEGYGTTYSLPL